MFGLLAELGEVGVTLSGSRLCIPHGHNNG